MDIANGTWEGTEPKAHLTIYSHWPTLKRWRRRVWSPMYRFVDTGFCGLTGLKKHILICGFPRSGTTLLQMMLENGLPQARGFGREVGGWRAATYAWRNHALLISKVPHDVFRLTELRHFYARRPAKLKVILMVRDCRDVMTSRRNTGGPSGYCVDTERWRRYHRAFLRHRNDPDTLVVRYENLVDDPVGEQRRVEEFIGEKLSVPFGSFHTVPRPDFDISTLNGLRPVEHSLIGRWSAPEHRERIREIIRDLPELPEALVELGYEPNADWIEAVSGERESAAVLQA